jgi:hypothetical protein
MDDANLTRFLNAMYSRLVVQECQILALRQALRKAGLLDDEALEKEISKAVDIQLELHAKAKSEEERYASILRSFEGPVQ